MRLRTYEGAADALRSAGGSAEIVERFDRARRAGLDEKAVAAIARAEAGNQPRPDGWATLTEAVAPTAESDAALAAGHLALIALARQQIDKVADLRVDEEVRALLYDEFHFAAQPNRRYRHLLEPGTRGYAAQARLLTFARLPAGQLHFEVSGFPRRWLRNVPARHLLGTARYLAAMRGFAPVYETHIATRWTIPLTLLPDEEAKSYRRIARTMALNPQIRGTMSSSWLNDPALRKIDPHLAWRFDKLDHGAHLTTVGAAPDAQGAAQGNPKRAELIASGKWRPQTGVMLWQRDRCLEWGLSHA